MPVTEFLFYSDHAYQEPIHELLKAEVLGACRTQRRDRMADNPERAGFSCGQYKNTELCGDFQGSTHATRPRGMDRM